jgi:hypothetical protein
LVDAYIAFTLCLYSSSSTGKITYGAAEGTKKKKLDQREVQLALVLLL